MTAGASVPNKIAKPLFPRHAASRLTVTGERVLFVSSGASTSEITMAKTTPGELAMTLLYEGGLRLLSTNGKDVVFADAYSTIGSTDRVGSMPKYFGGWAWSLAMDDRDVFYTRRGVAKDGSDSSVWRVPIGGSGAGTQIAIGPVGSGLARDVSGLYVASAYTPPFETPVLGIAWLDPAGESVRLLASRAAFSDGYLALTPSLVAVLAEGKTPEIFTVAKSDGTVHTLTTVAEPYERELHADATHAYWVEAKQIRRVALDGTKPAETVFAGACSPVSIALDSEHLYFLTSPPIAGKGNTTVWKMKKP
ncbi:MAG: hypothetical protein HYV09_39880 [Deltaproteobacteria bacterium]|nr:hypothetical protein [Deltaproteobacteria bacterium]